MRWLFVVTSIFFAFLSPMPVTLACSGGGFENILSGEEIARFDLVVAATVHDVDDAGVGHILKVERYFKGSGGEFLVRMPYGPGIQAATHVRRYDTGCHYSGRTDPPRRINDFGYLGLWSNSNGTVSVGFKHSPRDGVVTFYLEGEGVLSLPVRDFEKLLLQLSEQTATTEPQVKPYPLMRFLIIETESGERYRLNPDRTLARIDPEKWPFAISDDGSHVVFRLDDRLLGLQYLATSKKPLAPWLHEEDSGATDENTRSKMASGLARYGWMHTVPGQFAQFSPNSDFAAVQEKTRLVVYLLSSVIGGEFSVGYGHRMVVREIAGFDATWRTLEEQQPLHWNANSTSIAYQDSRGIWLWKFLEDDEPIIVVEAKEGRELIDLSATGRYLLYGRPADWTLLDVLTGDSWKDSLITPDESRHIHFLSDRPEDLDQRGQLSKCSPPLISCPLVVVQSPHTGVGSQEPPQEVFWHGRDFLGLVYRHGFQSIRWSYALEDVFCNLRICRAVNTPEINAFAYDSQYEQQAFAFEDTRIGFGFHKTHDYYDSVDLSDVLDSPIIDLEWGQPIFYEGR